MKTKFDKLLSPFQIRQVKLRNRMVKLSAAMGLAADDGFVTDANLGFYEAIAKGGVGLIVVEHGFIDYPMGVTGPRRMAISDDKFIPGLAKLTQTIHKHKTPCFQQLGHSGPSQRWLLAPHQRPVSSSPVKENGPRGLSVAEIQELVEKYAKAARRAREAGFDGVEIHAAVFYLINSFLSRAWNRREDAYGCQSLENRARFLVDILQAIREQVGEDFAVGVRMNGAEYGVENGITPEESKRFARIIQDAGADYISTQAVGSGAYELVLFPEQVSYPEKTTPLAKNTREGALVPLSEAIKEAVNIPVIAAGMLDAELGERILRNGKADLIGINRRLLADPEYPNKVASSRLDDIAPCTACMHCWATQQAGEHIRCRINPALGREHEFAVRPAERKKRVLIVGGGPAGMEAARVAALRGHQVTLYEKGHSLGGLLPLAAMIKGMEIEDLPAIVSYLRSQLRKLGVEVRTNTEVNMALIKGWSPDAKPDAVVIASGGRLTIPRISGINRRNVLSNIRLHQVARRYLRFLGPRALRWLTKFYLPIGKTVIVIGGAMHGCELAEFLVKRGRRVTILEESEQLGRGIHDINRKRLLSWLDKKGVCTFTEVTCKEILERGVAIVTKAGEIKTIEADSVVVATAPVANTELFDALKKEIEELYLIGDSREPQTIMDAVDDGSRIGRMI